MKSFIQATLMALSAIVFCVTTSELWADNKLDLLDTYPDIAEELNNGPTGREFWIAIPPNESQQTNVPTRALEIYVTSRFDTEVTMEVPGFGFGPKTKPVKARHITTFTDAPEGGGEVSWAYEIRTSEVVTQKGIFLSADKPISVYVHSAKRFTSEGYMALPLSVWGKEYMHLAYYDYPEPAINRGGGFVIIAQDDDTQVNISLNGSRSFGKTLGGNSIGNSYDVTLQRGNTYMVQGDGFDRTFDLSGTVVKANKAIGLISFHMRTIIPISLGSSSRDNLMEMMPPISSWGREFVSVEFKRVDRGDFFRLVAAQPNTEFSVKYYDRDSKEQLGSKNGVLIRAGQWVEFEEVIPTPGTESIRGVAVWKTNKPALLMQYNYSSGWDGFQDYDPSMMLVPPVEQYVLGATFQTPSRADFNTNWLNILVEGDPDDPAAVQLKSMELDGLLVWRSDPRFIANRIPETNLYWARLNVSPGVHRLGGRALFGSTMYGFSQFESYSWPASMAINKIDEPDDVPPVIVIEEDETVTGDFNVLATETTNSGSDQIDQGIAAVELLEEHSTNFQLLIDRNFAPGEKVESHSFRLSVNDPSQDGTATILIRDRAGNVTIETLTYIGKFVTVPPSPIKFGGVRVDQTKVETVTINNPTGGPVEITAVTLARAQVFSFAEIPDVPFSIEAGAVQDITLQYLPTIETGAKGSQPDTDELLIEVEGHFTHTLAIAGRGIQPHISISDFEFPVTAVGEEICDKEALRVINNGTDVLTVTAIEGVAPPFRLDDDVVLPISIPVGEERLLGSVCFLSDEVGDFSATISFVSDAPDDDPNTSVLRGSSSPVSGIDASETPKFTLYQISPNPISETGSVEFKLQQSMPVTLHLFNSLGRQVMTLADGLRPAGVNRLVFDVKALPGGLYYYTLTAGEEQATLGMLITR